MSIRGNGCQSNVTVTFVNLGDLVVGIDSGGYRSVWENSIHRRERMGSKLRRVDGGVIFENVPFDLVKNLATPYRNTAIERGDRQQEIAKRRRIQHARVENDALTLQREGIPIGTSP